MKLKKLCIFVLALLMAFFLIDALPFNVSAEADLPVHNNNTGLNYATIQEAINADETLDGHTIYVDAGTHYENVVVNKSVALVGQDKSNTIVDGHGVRAHVIYVTAENVSIIGFTIQNSISGYSGIYIYNSGSNNVSNNIIKNNKHGIYLYGSGNNTVSGNIASNNEYGIRLYGSGNNTVSGNTASNNGNGIHLDDSSDNVLSANNVSSNDGNGIYLYGSGNNTVSVNSALNNGNGIRLHASSDNILSGNEISKGEYGIYLYRSTHNSITGNILSSNDEYGIYLYESSDNVASENEVSNSSDGIYLYGSGNNTVSGNIASNNEYGIRLWNSSDNLIFHNNFIKNKNGTEQPSNTSFRNSWDNGAEGNYWSDYNGTDENRDGIGDTPYLIDERVWLGVYSRDNYPLMATFVQFKVAMENQSHAVDIVSNSTISAFQYHPAADEETSAVSFNVTGEDGAFGFCRIRIPHVLVEPPYTVMVDDDPPLYNNTVRTNGTDTWLYFTYHHSKHEIIITHTPDTAIIQPIWSQFWFWAIFGLAAVSVILLSLNFKYRRMLNEQKKVIQAYSPLEIARALFKADVRRRRVKIGKFEEKYGVKIRPRNTLEAVIRRLKEMVKH